MSDKSAPYTESMHLIEDGMGAKIFIQNEEWNELFSFALLGNFGKDDTQQASGISFVKRHRGEVIQPFLKLHKDTVQQLFNQLWQVGFRPKDGTGNSGHIEAMKYHLEDMRKLVFERNKNE